MVNALRNQDPMNWVPLENSHEGIVSSTYDAPSGVKCVMAKGAVNMSAQRLFEIIWGQTEEEKKKDDDSLISDIIISDHGTSVIRYQSYKCPFPISNRDFLFLRTRREVGGVFYQIDKSYVFDEVPKKSGFVRGEVVVGAYIYEPIDENSCNVTYITQVDPCGNLPKFFVNMNVSKVPNRIVDFRKIAENQ